MRAKIPSSVSEREEKLKQGLAEEVTRKNVNDSKFRAVAQRMDYPGFHQMVLGANLRPTKAGEVFSISSQKSSFFNSSYNSAPSSSTPLTSKPILSTWRQSSSTQRVSILQDPSFIASLSKFPDFTILAEILSLLLEIEDSSLVNSTLSSLVTIHEFKGCKKLLSRKEKESLERLLQRISDEEILEFFG